MNKVISDQYDWDELLELISDKRLVPVVGKRMYGYKDGDNTDSIDQYFAIKILELHNVTDYTCTSLREAVNYLQLKMEIKTKDINRKLKGIAREINFELPVIDKLTAITDINYFINTTVYSNLLEASIEKNRKKPTLINFTLNEPFKDCPDLNSLDEPYLFNVFGSLLESSDPALSDDDMLEYANSFNEKISSATNIISSLKNTSLLFLGCSFPDWMDRFALRLLANEPFHQWGTTSRTIIVVNDPDESRKEQYDFLKNYDVVTYDGSTAEFMHELKAQWDKKKPVNEEHKTVFLSYTVADKEAVENLQKAIEGLGNITCWYDRQKIRVGDDFDEKIKSSIYEADLFIPLISENSLLHKDGYIHYEWTIADVVNSTIRKREGLTDNFMMPIVIDGVDPRSTEIPPYFAKLSVGKVPGGNPTEDFLNQVKETLKLQ